MLGLLSSNGFPSFWFSTVLPSLGRVEWFPRGCPCFAFGRESRMVSKGSAPGVVFHTTLSQGTQPFSCRIRTSQTVNMGTRKRKLIIYPLGCPRGPYDHTRHHRWSPMWRHFQKIVPWDSGRGKKHHICMDHFSERKLIIYPSRCPRGPLSAYDHTRHPAAHPPTTSHDFMNSPPQVLARSRWCEILHYRNVIYK